MGDNAMGSATDRVINFALGEIHIPTDRSAFLDSVRHAVIDAVGVMIAGSADKVGQVLSRSRFNDTTRGPDIPAAPEEVALGLGLLGHAYDFDDSTPVMPGHPSVPVLAAIFALVDRAPQLDFPDLLRCYMVGVEVAAKLGRAIGSSHYNAGWHSTGTHGAIGATVASARLLGLDPAAARNALAVAVSEASGLQTNFGTMTKPLHSGIAARNAVTAVRLAEAGITGSEQPIEGPQGYLDVYGGPGSDAGRLTDLGSPWVFTDPGIYLKQYPCCFATHRPLAAIRDIQRTESLDVAQIDSVRVAVPAGCLRPLRYRRPRNGREAKFSMEYTVARQLVTGMVDLDAFRDDQVGLSDVIAMMERCTVVEDVALAPDDPRGERESSGTRGEVEVTVVLTDGRELARRVRKAPGGVDSPLSEAAVVEKFVMCVDHAGVARPVRDELLRLLLTGGAPADIAAALRIAVSAAIPTDDAGGEQRHSRSTSMPATAPRANGDAS